MTGGATETSVFLDEWNRGSSKALQALIERHLPWIEEQVRRRLGPRLRSRGETLDYVQDAMIQFLRYGPRFHLTRDEHFRAFLVRVVENSLRNRYDWFTAQRRDIARERPLPSDTILSLDPPLAAGRTPSLSAARHEREAWIRLGMELLEADDREVLVLRQWRGMGFAEIAEKLEITPDAARMRHNAAVRRLAARVQELRSGRLLHALEDSASSGGPAASSAPE